MPLSEDPADRPLSGGAPAPKPKPQPSVSTNGSTTVDNSAPPSNTNVVPTVNGDESLAAVTDEQIINYIYQNYGYMAWAMEIPELRDVLIEAHREGWGEAEIKGGISATNWWKTTEPKVRQFVAKQVEDPAALHAEIADVEMELQLAAARLGVDLADNRVLEIATEAVKYGWSDSEIQRALLAEDRYDPEVPLEGLIGDQTFDAKELASKYLVPMSDQVANDWARKILNGEATAQGFETYLRETAIGMFPTMKSYIEQGITPAQYFEPYAQTASKLLEKPMTVGDLFANTDEFQMFDDKEGVMKPLTLSQFSKQVRGRDDWWETSQAKSRAAELANFLGRTFGRV